MKSTIKLFLAVFAASMVFSSCTKDDQTEVGGGSNFTADIEQGLTRTTLIDNQYIGWYYGDKVAINGTLYSASPKGKVATSADLIYVDGNIPAAPYKAIYPASLYDAGTGTYVFPETQEYQEGRFNAPMYAESHTKSLQFRNICGVLCFSLKGNEKVRSIEITSSRNQFYGPFVIDENGNANLNVQEQQIPLEQAKGEEVYYNNPYGHVCLDCGEEGVQLYENMARNFYVYLPAQTYAPGMKVIITTTNGVEKIKSASQEIMLEANTLYTFNWDLTVRERVLLLGDFTVNGNGKKVKLTTGNLYWDGTALHIEDGQWKTIPTANIDRDENHVSQFYWCNTVENATSFTYTENDYYGDDDYFFCDENHKITVDGLSGLYALSWEEWDYLMCWRTKDAGTASSIGETEDACFMMCNLKYDDENSICGTLIFPDVFTWPSSVPMPENGTVNALLSREDLHTYNREELAELEAANVIFLPAAGLRDMDDSPIYGYDVLANYWSSTPYYWVPTLLFNYDDGWFDSGNNNWRHSASSIRLVKNVE